MAESASASAPPSARPTFLDPTSPDLDDLALQACDDAETLNDVMRAYTALEKLVDPSALNDSEGLTPSCAELSALLRPLNDALHVRIDAVNSATVSVHEALQRSTP